MFSTGFNSGARAGNSTSVRLSGTTRSLVQCHPARSISMTPWAPGATAHLAAARLDDQEVSVHALHLLQACLVYVNTLMLQRVLSEPEWMARMTSADRRGLTPLVWGHVSPYGAFDLDMEQRLDLDVLTAA